MSDPTYKALYRIGPIRYTTQNVRCSVTQTEQIAIAVTGTQAAGTNLATAAPTALRGAYLSLQAEGADMYIAFSDVASETTAALTAATRTGSGDSVCGFRLYAGQPPEEFCVPPGYPFLHAVTVSGSGVLRGFVSSPVSGYNVP
jgi:hypothetical protein